MSECTILATSSLDEAIAALRGGDDAALGLGRETLQGLLPQLPGSRILDGLFHRAGMAIALPSPALLEDATVFIEAAKTDGTISASFDRHGMPHAVIAPVGHFS